MLQNIAGRQVYIDLLERKGLNEQQLKRVISSYRRYIRVDHETYSINYYAQVSLFKLEE
jgi:hypothetical protein